MTELETLIRAKEYIDKLSNGINPLTDEITDENDLINNVRISRCLFYVSDVLEKVIAAGGITAVAEKRNRRRGFYITEEQRAQLTVFDCNVYAKDIVDRINELTAENGAKKFQAKWITAFFLSIGMMKIVDGTKRATESGEELGIITKQRFSDKIGTYWVNQYTPDAQQFIIDNIDAIVANAENAIAAPITEPTESKPEIL